MKTIENSKHEETGRKLNVYTGQFSAYLTKGNVWRSEAQAVQKSARPQHIV
jgi:hypothetical protein